MPNKYQIKEVKIPLSTGEIIFFYPQIERKEYKTTGAWWWKKTTSIDEWKAIYKSKKGEYFTFQYSDTELVSCKSIEEARAVIKEIQDKAERLQKEDEGKSHEKLIENMRNQGIEWTDDRYVKIHEARIDK